jgi:plastocyanin
MRSARSGIVMAVLAAFTLTGVCYAASDIPKKFKRALDEKDFDTMTTIVEANRGKIPAEIRSLMDEALSSRVSSEEQESEFIVAEFMASEYKNLTGEIGLLRDVKRRIFESKLDPPVVHKPDADGTHVIRITNEKKKNILEPGNIVIRKGETVKWINDEGEPHLLASMPVIGASGMSSPRIEPGGSWQFKFDEPGEYYYICFIHKKMFGKITVEDVVKVTAEKAKDTSRN